MKTEYLIAGKNGKGLQFQKNILMWNKFEWKKSEKILKFVFVSIYGKIFLFYAYWYRYKAVRRPKIVLDQHWFQCWSGSGSSILVFPQCGSVSGEPNQCESANVSRLCHIKGWVLTFLFSFFLKFSIFSILNRKVKFALRQLKPCLKSSDQDHCNKKLYFNFIANGSWSNQLFQCGSESSWTKLIRNLSKSGSEHSWKTLLLFNWLDFVKIIIFLKCLS